MAQDFSPQEFDRVECRRHVLRFSWGEESRLCAACLHLPGWFKNAQMREALDPEHDGVEVVEKIDSRHRMEGR